MKNLIQYYYNLEIDEINEHNDFFIIESNEEIFILKKLYQDVKELENMISLLNSNRYYFHNIVFNFEGNIVTNYNNENYVLIKIDKVQELIDNNFQFIFVEMNNDFSKLWEEKIDYFARQINELQLDDNNIIESFNYYMGLAENALSYYNRTIKMDGIVRFSVVHRRIYYPNYGINYYDPTTMIVDVFVRDIAEYVKNKFFYGEINVEEIFNYASQYNITKKEMNLLYARLLFPTYYFDIFNNNLNQAIDKEKLNIIISKRQQYEIFLREIYEKMKNNYELFEIEWLKKRTNL